jgi:glycosyltransferase 2 family protein
MKRFQKPLIILITILFIVLIVANISLKDIGKSLYSLGIGTLSLCLLIHFFVYLLRSSAMYVFLHKEVPFRYLLVCHLIHNFYLNILPVNLGEFSLPIMLNKYVSKTRSFSVLVITRIFSAIVMLFLFIISIFSIFHTMRVLSINIKYLLLGLAGLIIGCLAYLTFFKHKSNNLGLISKIQQKIITLKDSIIKSVKEEFTIKKVVLLSVITLAYATFLALFFKVILARLGISFSIIDLFFIMSLQLAVLILPIKSFAGIGTTEGMWMIGMIALGVGKKVALESGVVVHIVNLFSAAVFFLIGLSAKSFLDKRRSKLLQELSR